MIDFINAIQKSLKTNTFKTAIIIGNGKSTKLLYDYGFDKIPKNIDTYCTSLAFRFCEDLNYDPTYYVFADPKSVQYQEKNLTNYINKSKTQTVYLCYNNDKMFKSCSRNKIVKIKHNASGPAALEIAIQKNYDRILIIGLDHNYTWIKKHVTMLNDENKAQYKYDVVNHPSYFYPYYLKKGDIVSWDMSAKDNEQKYLHCRFTQELIDKASKKNIEIIDFGDNLLKNVKKHNVISDYLNV